MCTCKNYKSEKVVKKCKECGYCFVISDNRTNAKIAALKALYVLFFSLGKGSYNMLGKLFGRNRSLIYCWIREAGLNTKEPTINEDIKLLASPIVPLGKTTAHAGRQRHRRRQISCNLSFGLSALRPTSEIGDAAFGIGLVLLERIANPDINPED